MGSGLLVQGLLMLALGMGTVYVFLGLLVLVTSAMSALVRRYLPAAAPEPAPAPSAPAPGADPVLLAAIAAAIHCHRGGRSD